MISLHRTTDNPPLAVLRHGRLILLFPWADLLDLRGLVARVAPEMAADEDAPRVESVTWAASGSSFGIALMRKNDTLFFEAEEWRDLQMLLYVGQELLTQMEVAEIVDRPQPRIAEAIATGALFAFQVPGRERRQWLIPRRAVEEWNR